MKRLKIGCPSRYGNITRSVARLQWMVRFDNEAEDVQVSSRAIKLVDSTVAAKIIVAPANADGVDPNSSESESDKSDKSSLESDSEGGECLNIYAERRRKYQADYAKLVGSKIAVIALFLFLAS